MLTLDAALEKARTALTTLPELRGRANLTILEQHVRARARGWVFPYDGLVGYGPLFVDKTDGTVHLLPSARVEEWLDAFDRTGVAPPIEGTRWRWVGRGPAPSFLPASFSSRRGR